MKKIAVFCLAGFAASAVMAEDVVEQDNQEQVIAEKNPFDGFSVGAGVGGSFLQNKSDGVKKQNVNRFIGDIYAGYGKVLVNGKLYLGVEALLEMTSSKKNNAELSAEAQTELNKRVKKALTEKGKTTSDEKGEIVVGNKAFTPELTLKAGYVAGNNMFYAKGGIAFPRAELTVNASYTEGTTKQTASETKKINKVAPVVYLGVARAFGSKWNANIEAGYQFEQKENDYKVNGGWKVRAGVAYTFDF